MKSDKEVLEEIKARVEALPDEKATTTKYVDGEHAHSEEDKIHRLALVRIARGSNLSKEIARAACATYRKRFPRWYA